jgi:hypothetical protein
MAVVTTKSASIINLDASPIVANTIGEGAPGVLRSVTDGVTAVVGDSIGSVYRLVRIPSNAKIKRVWLSNFVAATAGAGDLGIAFSDSLTDGTQPQFTALANPVVQTTGPADNKLFGTAKALTAQFLNTDMTFQATPVFLAAHQNLPLWQVLVNLGTTQFTADPGGFFDLVMKLTIAITVATGVISAEVDYVE